MMFGGCNFLFDRINEIVVVESIARVSTAKSEEKPNTHVVHPGKLELVKNFRYRTVIISVKHNRNNNIETAIILININSAKTAKAPNPWLTNDMKFIFDSPENRSRRSIFITATSSQFFRTDPAK